MMKRRIVLAALVLLFGARVAIASGPIGIYGVVEKVVFDPSEKAPTRVQVWGAFAYVNGAADGDMGVSPVKRGYLYFQLPALSGSTPQSEITNVLKEWADLKAVAGTGQAVGFGRWFYIAGFGALQPDARPRSPSIIVLPQGGNGQDVRVRPASEMPADPAVYHTNTGVVKVSEQGGRADLVKALREAIRR